MSQYKISNLENKFVVGGWFLGPIVISYFVTTKKIPTISFKLIGQCVHSLSSNVGII